MIFDRPCTSPLIRRPVSVGSQEGGKRPLKTSSKRHQSVGKNDIKRRKNVTEAKQKLC